MFRLALLLLLPLTVCAQLPFGPLRLDDSSSYMFFNPRLDRVSDTELRCIWGARGENLFTAEGQFTDFSGNFIGPRWIYDTASVMTTCPPAVAIVPLSTGGEARLIEHS